MQDKTPWAPLKEMWPTSEETYVIQDFVCEELQQLVSNNTVPHMHCQQMKMLFGLLEASWDAQHRYSKYATTQLLSGTSNSVLRDSIPSSFAIALQTLQWVPGVESSVVTVGDSVMIEEKESLLPPSMLYIPGNKIKKSLSAAQYDILLHFVTMVNV